MATRRLDEQEVRPVSQDAAAAHSRAASAFPLLQKNSSREMPPSRSQIASFRFDAWRDPSKSQDRIAMAALTVFLAAAGYMAPMLSRPVASRSAVSMQMNKKARSPHTAHSVWTAQSHSRFRGAALCAAVNTGSPESPSFA
jgi:hypothetical protein